MNSASEFDTGLNNRRLASLAFVLQLIINRRCVQVIAFFEVGAGFKVAERVTIPHARRHKSIDDSLIDSVSNSSHKARYSVIRLRNFRFGLIENVVNGSLN